MNEDQTPLFEDAEPSNSDILRVARERAEVAYLRRPAGLNSPATRSSAGFVMREIQTGLHKPEGGTKQRLTKSADNSAPVYFPKCAWTSLGSWVSFDLPLALTI